MCATVVVRQGLTQLDAWIDPTQLEGGLEEICADGFQIRRSGLTLATSLPSPAPREVSACLTSPREMPAKSIMSVLRQVVFCTVGVGKALCVEEQELSESPELEQGYDSHLVLGSAEQSPPALYRYRVYDAAQVNQRRCTSRCHCVRLAVALCVSLSLCASRCRCMPLTTCLSLSL